MWTRSFNFPLSLFILIWISVCIKCDTLTIPSNTDYDQFIEKDVAHIHKCCPINTALFQANETSICSATKLELKHVQIFSSNIKRNYTNFAENCINTQCVDYLKNGTEWDLVHMQDCKVIKIYKQLSHFPKCCPFDHVYDPRNHTCINQNRSVYLFNGSLQAISVSLSQCPAVNAAITDFHGNFTIDYESKDLNLGTNVSFAYGTYCIDRDAFTGKDMIRACVKYEEACEKYKRRCLKKCCRDGEIFIIRNGKSSCEPYYIAPFNVTNISRFNGSDNEYGIILAGKGQRQIAGPQRQFYIDEFGNFHVEENGEWRIYNPKDAYYCLEHWERLGKLTQSTFLFLRNNDNSLQFKIIKFYVQGVILAVSCILLFITILCYLFLPEMHNVHGKSMLMFCIFMFGGSITLCLSQLHILPYSPRWMCASVGFTIIFTFLGSFAWLNVICFDMWMAFGTMRVLDIRNKRKDFKKFLYYNLYAWGVPIIICGFALIVYNTECLPNDFVPRIGVTKCFFEKIGHSYDYLTFFIIPEATMILVNLIFFVKTSIYCFKVKNEIQRMRSVVGNNKASRRKQLQDEKDKLMMLLKLFLVMGISWTFEIVSSVVSFRQTLALQIIEAICDCINAAEGIIIFSIFILKKKVFLSIKTRLGMIPTRRISEFSSAVTTLSGPNSNTQTEISRH